MNSRRNPDVLINAFLGEGVTELPDRSYDAVRAATEQTRQWVVIGPWREQQMTRFAVLGVAAAAVVLAAVVGLQFLPSDGGMGVGGQPTASPLPSPTLSSPASSTSSVAPTPIVDPAGVLQAGTYVFHPFGPDDPMEITVTVPAGWVAWDNDLLGLFSPVSYDPPDGAALGALRVHSLNRDPCQWLGSDDIVIGPTVEDLASALKQQAAYEASDPVDVTVGGYEGKRVDLTLPDFDSEPGNPSAAIGCDDESYLIWNATGFDIYAQGPSNRWHVWIVDVEGSRVVILAHDFPGTSEAIRAQYEAIVESMQIKP